MRIFVVLAALLASAVTSAAPAPDTITADQAVALYRERSTRLQAAKADVDIAQADVIGARIYPNPSIGLSTTNTVGGTDTIGHSQETLSLDIPILIGHQRGKREAAAKAHVESARVSVEADAASVELEIRHRVVALQAAQEKTTALGVAADDARKLREIVVGRTAAGASSAYAVQRIDLAIAALSSRVDEAKADELAASHAVGVAVGIADWAPHASAALAPAAAADEAAVDAMHPALALPQREQTAARADEETAHAEAVPTPSLQLAAFATTDPGGVAVTGGVAIPLPMFDRNQGAVAKAHAEARRAELELTARKDELSAALASSRDDLRVRRDALTKFQTDAVANLDKLRTMAEASYKNGQGGVVELLDALDAITEARMREIDLRAAVVDGEVSVRAAARGR
ncbi:MAG TPA: TolC family protein [Kofleriaceae bacterium]|jgi:cobalt-zinc-cadmium efflux system outer membrane protein